MSQLEVIAKMQAVFDEVFLDPVVLRPEVSAKDVPEWDSIINIPLIIALEKAFNIRFRVGEVAAVRNIGEFADLIDRRLAGG